MALKTTYWAFKAKCVVFLMCKSFGNTIVEVVTW